MSELTLDVRIDGFAEPAGVLVRDDRGAVAFAYTASHLARADALPLSLSLPMTDEPYDDVSTRAFFDNLLQESDGALNAVMAREGLARDDIAGLMLHLGKDCPGALSVLAKGAPPVKVPGDLTTDYAPFSDDRFAHGLSDALDELTQKGMKPFADLIASNLRQLLPMLGVAVLAARGGGWLNS
jgi:serine/threonine-protein kinase HipA